MQWVRTAAANDVTADFFSLDWMESREGFDFAFWQSAAGIETFVRDVIEWPDNEDGSPGGPADYQVEIVRDLIIHRRVAVRGPHGLGKSALAAWVILYFMLAYEEDVKVVTTASAWRQLKQYLWPEVHKWAGRIRWQDYGMRLHKKKELLDLEIKLPRSKSAFAVASDQPALIEGAHAAVIVYIFDESKTIPPETWDAAEGAFSTGSCVLGSTLVTGAGSQFVTRREYEGDIVEIETAAGYKLSVTPNHPILTPGGWVTAGSLQPSDEIISCGDTQSLMRMLEPDAVQVPARIKDVFEASAVLDAASASEPVMLSSKHLNRAITDGQVNVKTTDSSLNDWHDSMLDQDFVNRGFIHAADLRLQLPGLSGSNQREFRPSSTTKRMASERSPLDSVFGMSLDIGPLSGEDISAVDTPLIQAPTYNRTGNPEASGDFADRLSAEIVRDDGFTIRRIPSWMPAKHAARFVSVKAKIAEDGAGTDSELFANLSRACTGLVFIDHVLHLVRRQLKTHVYNLQTETHWYTASEHSSNSEDSQGGIIVHNCYALAISTPGEASGRFYDIHSRVPGYEDWWVKHVTIEMALAAGRIKRDWVEQRRIQWETKYPQMWHNRVLGEFYTSAPDSVIPFQWIELAHERWYERQASGEMERDWNVGVAYGLDVADEGDDSSALCRLSNYTIQWLKYFDVEALRVAGEVQPHIDKLHKIGVDAIGVGAGTYQRLRELEYKAVAVKVSEKAEHSDGTKLTDKSGKMYFLNLRSWLWWRLREMLDPEGDDLLALPPDGPDGRLTGDLSAPKWKTRSDGVIIVEQKKDTKARTGRSPDAADCILHAIHTRFVRRPLRIW